MTKTIEGPDPLDIAIGSRIRVRRRALGLSQTALGEDLGVTFQQVQKYERGVNRVSGSTMVRVARVLGVPSGYLLGDEDGKAAAGAPLPLAHLFVSSVMETAEALAKVKSPALRLQIMKLVRSMAAEGEQDGAHTGGPVGQREGYRVGERGPETLRPS
jgi:transcriptional regulator with XRE-family HTH domain